MRLRFAFCLVFLSAVFFHFLPRVETKEGAEGENVQTFLGTEGEEEKDDVQHVFSHPTKSRNNNRNNNKKRKKKIIVDELPDGDIGVHLIDWIRKNGGYVNPKVSLLTEEDVMGTVKGVIARDKIEPEEEIAIIPKEVMLCVREDETECELAAMLVKEVELTNASFYWPYIRVMGLHHPVVFGLEEETLLEGLPPYNFFEIDEHFAKCGFDIEDEFLRGVMAMLWARVIYNDGLCLIPFWDSLNHQRRTNNVGAERKKQRVLLRARTDIAPGHELYHEYDQTTPALFTWYGFVENFPHAWFFDADDGIRYNFEVDQDEFEIIHGDDGKPIDPPTMLKHSKILMQNLHDYESTFMNASTAYKGDADLLELIKEYRNSFMYAIELAQNTLLEEDREDL